MGGNKAENSGLTEVKHEVDKVLDGAHELLYKASLNSVDVLDNLGKSGHHLTDHVKWVKPTDLHLHKSGEALHQLGANIGRFFDNAGAEIEHVTHVNPTKAAKSFIHDLGGKAQGVKGKAEDLAHRTYDGSKVVQVVAETGQDALEGIQSVPKVIGKLASAVGDDLTRHVKNPVQHQLSEMTMPFHSGRELELRAKVSKRPEDMHLAEMNYKAELEHLEEKWGATDPDVRRKRKDLVYFLAENGKPEEAEKLMKNDLSLCKKEGNLDNIMESLADVLTFYGVTGQLDKIEPFMKEFEAVEQKVKVRDVAMFKVIEQMSDDELDYHFNNDYCYRYEAFKRIKDKHGLNEYENKLVQRLEQAKETRGTHSEEYTESLMELSILYRSLHEDPDKEMAFGKGNLSDHLIKSEKYSKQAGRLVQGMYAPTLERMSRLSGHQYKVKVACYSPKH